MKKFILILFFASPIFSFAQLGVSFHHSNLPFLGINYEFVERFRPELRFGTDAILENVSLELALTYDILSKEHYEFYSGAGLMVNYYTGIVIPIGLNIYPFEHKNFGFQMELAPILNTYQILRGSFGIRYRFGEY